MCGLVCDARCVVGQVVSLRHSTSATPAAALLQFVYETAHLLLVLPLGVVALTPLALAEHQVIGCVVWCVVCRGGVWGCFVA